MRACQKDIPCAALLNDKEMGQCIELLKSDPKTAKMIAFPDIDFSVLVAEVNAIMQHKVEEKTKIVRLEDD